MSHENDDLRSYPKLITNIRRWKLGKYEIVLK